MMDHAVRCHECDFIAYPLSKEQAIDVATEHTGKRQHTKCYAITESELLPLVGYFSSD